MSHEKEFANEILVKASYALEQGKPLQATDIIVDALDDLIYQNKFDIVGVLMEKLDVNIFPPVVLTGILMYTNKSKEKIGLPWLQFLSRTELALKNTWGYSDKAITKNTKRYI